MRDIPVPSRLLPEGLASIAWLASPRVGGRLTQRHPPGVYVETPTQKDHPPPKREDPGGYEKSLPRFLSRQAFLQL